MGIGSYPLLDPVAVCVGGLHGCLCVGSFEFICCFPVSCLSGGVGLVHFFLCFWALGGREAWGFVLFLLSVLVFLIICWWRVFFLFVILMGFLVLLVTFGVPFLLYIRSLFRYTHTHIYRGLLGYTH